jgi:dihydroxyacetone kinase/dihydroxyacetone kinase-like protein
MTETTDGGSSAPEPIDLVIRTMATTIVANADYFAQLDAVAGDGDFGYSLRNGFEQVLTDYDSYDRSAIGPVLKKVGFAMASKVGGVSGPIWGTAFLRAAAEAGDRSSLTPTELVAVLRAAAAGIMQRGEAALGDKTLLDALVPAIDALEEGIAAGEVDADRGSALLQRMADVATQAAKDTEPMIAKRGRAAYTGERSRGSVDAGATAVGVILQDISAAWRASYGQAQGGPA